MSLNVVVTGATSGIGLQIAKHFVQRAGNTVYICGRDEKKLGAAKIELSKVAKGSDIEIAKFDLSDVGSTLMSAIELRARAGKVDLLFNNAGVMAPPVRLLSPQGFEVQFATNHLGHFVLTAALIDLVAEANGRVITISSIAAKRGKIDFDNLNGEQSYSPWGSYSQSKLANLLFAIELDRRLKAANSSAISLSAHPGYSSTSLTSTGQKMANARALAPKFLEAIVAQSARKGALPAIEASHFTCEGWEYFGPRGPFELRGRPTKVRPPELALDEDTAARLWEVSEELTETKFEI
ncbi:MAG: oxidoreductase [Actinomycetota bacterium]|nr:oxidoreductase [Actinomycetota bacterium]